MESFARLVEGWASRIARNMESSGVPSQDALYGFIGRSIVPSIKRGSAGAPAHVIGEIKEAFSAQGWDIGANRPVEGEEVSPEGLSSIFATLKEKFPRKDDDDEESGSGSGAGAGAGAGSSSAVPEVDVNPTDEELGDIRLACTRLWDLDSNRLVPGRDYELDIQQGTRPYSTGDRASRPLFKRVDPSIWRRPTYRTFRMLLDNYESATGIAETVTRAELSENRAFLAACMKTNPMRYAHRFLAAKGMCEADEDDFLKQVEKLWFKLYRRDTRGDSSGFEHVFIGEHDVDADKISGMHNWVQIFIQESIGALDYKGYISSGRKRGSAPPADDHILTFQFSWNDELKPISTSFIGVSPEFELALYTLCFMFDLGADGDIDGETITEVGPYDVKIRAYKIGRDMIGTAFPDTDLRPRRG